MPSNSRMSLTALRAARYPGRYAAGTGERAEMIRDSSRREVPRISRDLTSRSKDTEGSPASIFAMRDWLDWRRLARSACVRLRRRRRSRRPTANRALRSIYAASSALRRRNSWAFPNFQPFASKRRRFASRMVVQIIRLRLEMLYTSTLMIRPFFCACFIAYYVISQDPFFLVLLAIVALGVIWTGFSFVMDKQSKPG